MTIYLVLLALLFLSGYWQSNNKLLSYISMGLFLAVSMFRAETVGLDTYNYMHVGSDYVGSGIKAHEFVFYFVVKLMPILGNRFVIIFFSLVTFISIFLASRRFNVRAEWAFFFFVIFVQFNLSLNIARQFAAVGLLLLAYSFLYEDGRKKRLMFFLLSFIATGIHSAAWVFPIAYAIRFLNIRKMKPSHLYILIVFIYLLVTYLSNSFFVEWANAFALFDDIEVYSKYFEQTELRKNASLGNQILNYGMLAINLWVAIHLLTAEAKDEKLVANLFFVAVFADLFFSNLYGNLGRTRYCFTIINIIAYALYFRDMYDRKKLLMLLAVIVFFGYNYYYSLSNTAYGTVPYNFDF